MKRNLKKTKKPATKGNIFFHIESMPLRNYLRTKPFLWNSETPKLDEITQNRMSSKIDEMLTMISFRNNCKDRPNSLREALKCAETRGEDPGRQQTIAFRPTKPNLSYWMEYSSLISILYKRDNQNIDSVLTHLRNGYNSI